MRQVKVLNRLLDGFEGKLTTSKYDKLTKGSQDMAHRDILDLVERGVLRKDPGGGRSTSYSLIMGVERIEFQTAFACDEGLLDTAHGKDAIGARHPGRDVCSQGEIFVDFITGNHDAFVIEDADHMLMARSNGNVDLHRFLAVADGVVCAQGRKIIFTTNLPNIGDIDEALVRPGRCFATVRIRALDRREAACSGVGYGYALDNARSVVSAGGC